MGRTSGIHPLEYQIEKLLEKLNKNNTHIEVTSPDKPARHHQPAIKICIKSWCKCMEE